MVSDTDGIPASIGLPESRRSPAGGHAVCSVGILPLSPPGGAVSVCPVLPSGVERAHQPDTDSWRQGRRIQGREGRSQLKSTLSTIPFSIVTGYQAIYMMVIYISRTPFFIFIK